MARRAASAADEDRRFRRLAAQLGVSRHVLGTEDAAEGAGVNNNGGGPTPERQPPAQHEAADDEHQVQEEIELQRSHDGEENEEEEEDEEEDAGELSLTLPSDSASEGLSSDLSLPHSFGHYDQIPTGQSISQFDDHLTRMSPGRLPTGRANRLHQMPQGTSARGTSTASSTSDGSEAVMKKFYEIQVGKIRAQLALSVQAQRELEKTLQEERTSWQEKTAELQVGLRASSDHCFTVTARDFWHTGVSEREIDHEWCRTNLLMSGVGLTRSSRKFEQICRTHKRGLRWRKHTLPRSRYPTPWRSRFASITFRG